MKNKILVKFKYQNSIVPKKKTFKIIFTFLWDHQTLIIAYWVWEGIEIVRGG